MRRRGFLSGALAMAALPACAAPPPSSSARPGPRPPGGPARLAPRADDLIARAALGGALGYAVADARTGQLLEARGALTPLPPASVAKAATALYALETLGPAHRFVTRVVATGPVTGGRLDGDLVLLGGGDPSLDTDGLHDLAGQVRAAGITVVGGRLLVWDGALPFVERIDASQPDHVGYNPAVSGLNLNFNRVHFSWKRNGRGYETALDARTERFRPAVTAARMRVADRALPVYTYARGDGVDEWTVARAQLGEAGSRWLPVRDPSAYAGEVLRAMLAARGVAAPAARGVRRPPEGREVARVAGADLERLARVTLRWSTNLAAEAMGLAATRARGIAAGDLGSSANAMTGWLQARAETGRTDFDDHSGLNATSRVAPLDMVRILSAPGVEARLRPALRDMTLSEAGIPLRAKTGTLNFVSGLAGYFPARSGRMLAFATFTANLDRRGRLSVGEMERPEGGRGWGRRSRRLQFDLVERWAAVHG
jgi:D-alanyl-D-alanine carboxypeptidase/D-alanyl-D-alanine-endopeptidase (penicillin-binding protein 4)